jgi:glycosidase
MITKPIIYQLVVRYFGNTSQTNKTDGDLATNGCGKFNDINTNAIQELKKLGITHVWLTGVLRQATLTDYTADGMPADTPDIVKGRAGSFYAVRDYADVCPDYASTPVTRMVEFEALVQRLHDADIKVLIDLVPNHVSRNYDTKHPSMQFGAKDDKTKFFDPANNFFYLAEPPGQRLTLTKPQGWNPAGVTFTGSFVLENGGPGRTPRATGNNVTSATPPMDSWYETVKLNWGFNFITKEGCYSPTPHTWNVMNTILAYWQDKGVDGFRCDFAHYVPAEAWAYLISQARERNPIAFFLGEAYPEGASGEPVQNWRQLVAAGFDGVYFYRAYNFLKAVYKGASLDAYAAEMATVEDANRCHLVTYLGNHDEVRLAAPIAKGGFGSPASGYQLAPLQFLYSSGPVLFFNGDEVGEDGTGNKGFSGDDGRTTTFDYWSMPVFRKWVNGHLYDGSQLSAEQKKLRRFYADLLRLCQDDAVRGAGYRGLRDHNQPSRFNDCPEGLYTFARFRPYAHRLLLVVANFQVGSAAKGQVRITRQLADDAGLSLSAQYSVSIVLDENGAHSSGTMQVVARLTRDQLCADGFPVNVSEQRSVVYVVE